MVTYTTTYNLAKPTVGDDEDVWGGYLNDNFDTLESLLKGTTSLTSLSLTGVLSVGNSSPKTWHTNSTGVIQFGGVGALENYNATDDVVIFSANAYRASDGNFKYIETNEASRLTLYAGDAYFQTAPSGTADTNATFTTRLMVKNTGNVGIGTDSPEEALHVEEASGAVAVKIESGNSDPRTIFTTTGQADYAIGIDRTDGKLHFTTGTGVGANQAMSINSSGNVGIGTTSPSEKLDVTGNIQTSENLKADGGNLIIGDDAYSTSTSYVGMKTSFMSGTTDYMMISGTSDGNTYVSAKSGSDVHIRGGGNNSVYAITVYPDQWPTVGNSAHSIWHAGNDGTGSGLDADTVDGIEASSFLRSDATDAFSGTITSSAAGIGMMFYGAAAWRVSSADSAHQRADARDDVGESRLHWYGVNTSGSSRAFKHAWYDGSAYVNVTASSSNINFERTTGTANLQVHGNTVWHAGNDGSGSGLDADTLDGVQGANYLRSDQADTFNGNLTISSTGTIGGSTLTNGYLQVTDGSNTLAMDSNEIVSNSTLYVKPLAGTLELGGSQTTNFGSNVNINGNLNAVDNIYVATNIYHEGDTDTKIDFGTNTINFRAGNQHEVQIAQSGMFLINSALHEDYDALSGTTPSVDPNTGGAWSLTLSGNTTFTFGGTISNYSTGIIIELTGNATTAYTVTWPTSVDWAGGTAPDAPAVGETDIYVFWTRDGGTTWYGVQSIDAAA